MLGWAFRLAGRFDESITQLKKCLEQNSNERWIWDQLGRAYKDMEDLDQAEFCFREAIALESDSAWAYCHLGLILLKKKDYSGAIEQFQDAQSYRPDYGRIHIGLADVFYDSGETEKAISEYEEGIKLEQRPFKVHEALLKLAHALETAGRTAEARQRYQEYLDRFPWGEHAQEAQEALERLGEK